MAYEDGLVESEIDMYDILIVEDNEELGALIERFLLREKYRVRLVRDGKQALREIREEEFRLLLIDIMLPSVNGFQICEETRKLTSVPILFMSAKTENSDKLFGYEIGGDDYIEKPFSIDVLIAKIKAQLRRTYEFTQTKKVLEDSRLSLNLNSRTLYVDKRHVALSIKEFEVLELLMKHANTTLRKEYIFTKIWGSDSESEPSTLTVHINKLRDKIEEDPKKPKRLVTVWGVGYRYVAL